MSSTDNSTDSAARFIDYAIKRLKRSGILTDISFVDFIYSIDKYIDTTKIDKGKFFLCFGSEDYFFFVSMSNITTWCTQHNKTKISIHKPNKSQFLELPDDLEAQNFTPIPKNQYTDYEAGIWLKNNPDIHQKIIDA